MRLSSASASIWSTITLRICAVLSAASCGISSTPRRSSLRVASSSLCISAAICFMRMHHGRELLGRLLEHRIGFVGALLVDLAHGVERLPALFLGRRAHRLELAADRGRAGAGGLRHDAGDVAGALLGSRKRFIEQAR